RLRPADRLAVRDRHADADLGPDPVPVGGPAGDGLAQDPARENAPPPALMSGHAGTSLFPSIWSASLSVSVSSPPAPAKAARSCAGSTAPSQRAMTIVATALPMKLVRLRHSLMNRSTPRIRAMPATGTDGTTDRVAARTMKPEPVTPAAPLDDRIATAISQACSL